MDKTRYYGQILPFVSLKVHLPVVYQTRLTLSRGRPSDIDLLPNPKHHPQHNGKIERLHGTFWKVERRAPGFAGRHVLERPKRIKNVTKMMELDKDFQKFKHKNNNTINSQTGLSPMDYWQKNIVTREVNIREMDILLMETAPYKVQNNGIRISNGIKGAHPPKLIYSHVDLAEYVGRRVLVRMDKRNGNPSEILVFDLKRKFICTATLQDPENGKTLSTKELRKAQEQQRAASSVRIAANHQAIQDAKREIAEKKEKLPEPKKEQAAPPSNADSARSESTQPKKGAGKKRTGFGRFLPNNKPGSN